MKTKNSKSENGQILIVLAVGFIFLMAFVALAIDGGSVYFDRRSAQNAADAAALAGAYELARNPWDTSLAAHITAASLERAHDNKYGTDDGKTVVVDYPPDAANIHFVAGDNNINHYIRVKITSTVSTSFLHFIYAGPVHNTVEAVAHVIPPERGNPFAGSGLVALAPHDCGRLTVGGNVAANLIGGGIFVNSDNTDCAASGGSGSTFVYTPSMSVVGGTTAKLESYLIVEPGPLQSPDPGSKMAYPPDIGIAPVPACTTAAHKIGTRKLDSVTMKDWDAASPNPSITFDEWAPGNMNGFPSANYVYFDPGIYCVSINNNGQAKINSGQFFYNDPTDPTRILLVIKGTSPCLLDVDGHATLQLKGYGAEPFKGLLFYFDPRNFASVSEGPVTFNGTSQSYINGTVYAPTCSIKLNGTGGNFYRGQVIGYDVTMTGGAAINMLFVESDNFTEQKPAKVDLNQ